MTKGDTLTSTGLLSGMSWLIQTNTGKPLQALGAGH